MKLTAPTNWDYAILEEIDKLNNGVGTKTPINEVYSSIKKSITGSARSAALIPNEINEKYAEEYIKETHRRGLEFNYLVNSSCLGNHEYLKPYRTKLVDYLKWIESVKADCVTVASPFITDLVKRHTNLKIVLSCVSDPRSVNRMNLLKQEGVARVVLAPTLNRNFPLLREIRHKTDFELELLANESCLLDCPYRSYHYLVSCHDSQSDLKITSFDYCLIKCSLARLNDPVQIMRSSWIRPEDLQLYADLGIDYAKLSGRIMPTVWINKSIRAYALNNFEGNLFDLIDQQKMYSSDFGNYIVDPEFGEIDIFIDNKKLTGFLKKVQKAGVQCGNDCGKCTLCQSISKTALHLDENKRKAHILNLNKVLDTAIEAR